MDSVFYIALHLRSGQEIVPVARFSVGTDRLFAEELFSALGGTEDDPENCPLLMEWSEEQLGLPVNLRLKGCSLAQVTANCGHITREVFKKYNLL